MQRFNQIPGYVSRRSLLQVGCLSGLGVSLPRWLQARERAPRRREKNCILLWMMGGASQIDLYDPKPSAPDGVRSLFKPIRTTVPGLHLTELLPRLAACADKFSLIRSMTSLENEHEVGHYFVQSGSFRWNPQAATLKPPGYGAMADYQLGARPGVPSFVQIGEMLASSPDAGMGGLLGRRFDPMILNGGRTVQSLGLVPQPGIDAARLHDRQHLLAALDRVRDGTDSSQRSPRAVHDRHMARALDMVTSPRAREAFDLEREPVRVRDDYGPGLGQRMLLARRLIEAGVRFVTVVVFVKHGWDHHPEIFPRLRDEAPPYDRGYAALLEDLYQRGLLENTLVLSVGEFGRTPRLNNEARGPGRDHWNRCFSMTIGGGGVRTGVVLGSSDAEAAYPKSRPVTINELAHTVYHVLGLEPGMEARSSDARPFVALPEGVPIQELL